MLFSENSGEARGPRPPFCAAPVHDNNGDDSHMVMMINGIDGDACHGDDHGLMIN